MGKKAIAAVATTSETPAKRKVGMEKAWETHMSVEKKARKITDSELGEKVRQALSGSGCSWASPAEIDGTVDPDTGLTLRGRLWRDKRAEANGTAVISFGRDYYRQLRKIYSSRDKVESQLENLTAEGATYPEDLLIAIGAALREQPNWSLGQKSLTRDSCIAILKVLNEVTETATPEQLHLAKAIVQCFCRLAAWTTHPDLLALMSFKLDSVLTEALLESILETTPPLDDIESSVWVLMVAHIIVGSTVLLQVNMELKMDVGLFVCQRKSN
eukprot:6460686-Amphidinium_carterae.3